MAPLLSWLDPGTGVEPDLTFTGLLPGAPSAVKTLHLVNGAGASAAERLELIALAKHAGDADFRAEGLAVLDHRAVQVRLAGGGWRPLGAAARVSLPDVPAGTELPLELRIALPAGAGSDDVILRLRLLDSRSTPLPDGSRAQGSGVLTGLGDPAVSAIVHQGGDVVPDGADTVTFPGVGHLHRGRPYRVAGADHVFDLLDGDAVAIVAGEGYGVVASLSDAGLTLTRGSKALLPLTPDDYPAAPAGDLAWIQIERGFDGIQAEDVQVLATVEAFGIVSIDGRSLEIGPGRARVGEWMPRNGAPEPVEAPADAVSTVWQLPDGSREASASPSDPDALALYDVTTDALDVVSVVDRRHFRGGEPVTAVLRMDGTANASALWANPYDEPLYLLPIPGAVGLLMPEDPAGLGGVSGAWSVQTETLEVSGAWTSLWGTADGLPSISYDGEGSDVTSKPDRLVIPARALVRARVLDPVPATASDLVLTLALWRVA